MPWWISKERMMLMTIGGVNNLSTLNSTQKAMQNSMAKIATGSKFPSAANGPAEYGILQRMYSNAGAISQSNANTQTASSMLKTASGATENIVSSLSSLREKLIQAGNGTNGASDLATLQKSVDETIATIDQSAANATYNGKQLLDGSQSVTVAGADGYENVELGNLSSQGLGLTDGQGNTTFDLKESGGIAAALEKVDAALDTALNQSTSLGAAEQGMEYQSANYTTQETSLYDSASTMGDTDIAAEVTKLRSAQVQNQLALHAMNLQNHNRASVLSLLG
ncbi:MAG: bacitracin resistance protein BacA [Selenomonas ruminantium]|nr:bacitracin resistance protein BacA [Selenomonas ruminantium]